MDILAFWTFTVNFFFGGDRLNVFYFMFSLMSILVLEGLNSLAKCESTSILIYCSDSL